MSVFAMFADRATKVNVEGKADEMMVITRRGRTSNPQTIQNERMCVMQDNTIYEEGDLVIAPDAKYYIVAKQSSQTGAVQAHLRKVNCEVAISRLVSVFNDRKSKTGEREELLYECVPSVQYTVSSTMRLYDAGLLPGTVKKFILPELDIRLQDRIVIDENHYEVIGMNRDKYNSILEVQCGFDTRKADE